MMIAMAAITLLLQATPAEPQAPAAIAGVVVQAGTGQPVPNVRVALAKMDVALGPLAQMAAGDRQPNEITIPGEILSLIKEEIAFDVASGGAPPEEAADAAAIAALPVDDIEELIASSTGGVGVVYKSAPPAMTDSQGRFAFTNVPPGTYKLVFTANGYARQSYGQRSTAGVGTPIVLAAGAAKNDVVMRMTPVSAISGRIRDRAGQPIAGVPVRLYRYAYDETGRKKVQQAASAQTNDRGEYRLYFLSPGRYYLNAGYEPGQSNAQRDPFDPFDSRYVSQNKLSQDYAIAYYPGAADVAAATVIDLQPGADLSGIDWSLSVQQTYRVRGRVVDSRTGAPPPNAILQPLTPYSADSGFNGALPNFENRPNYKPSDGTFEIPNVAPGSYRLSVNLPDASPRQAVDFNSMSPAEQNAYFEAQRAVDRARPKASTNINVGNSDLDNVLLMIGFSGALNGRIYIDANAASTSGLASLRVGLKSPDGGRLAVEPESQPTKPDGSFRIVNLWPGEYRLSLNGLPSGYYVKQARLGSADVLNGTVRFSGDESDSLDILISPNTGQIDGSVLDARSQPAAGAQVVLIPERNRERTELFRSATADVTGHFSIPNMTPGDYRLAAWEDIEPYGFFDPVLIQQAERTGTPIRIAESSKQNVSLTAISVSR
jgi:hypothetical protein